MNKKEERERLFIELADAENEKAYLEYHKIPTILKQIKALNPTKKEIKENELGSYYEWND